MVYSHSWSAFFAPPSSVSHVTMRANGGSWFSAHPSSSGSVHTTLLEKTRSQQSQPSQQKSIFGEEQSSSHHRRDLLRKALAFGGLLLGNTAMQTLSPWRQPLHLVTRFTDPASASELGGGMPQFEAQAMSTGRAAEFIKQHCQGILRAYNETGATPVFLYRGENINRPTLLKCPPDLMDVNTYQEGKEAAAFFAKMEEAMEGLPVRPSLGHLATSDMRSAAAWGTPCSVWPLGNELHYAWLRDAKAFWPVRAEKRDISVDDIRACVKREIQVDQNLDMAVKMGHEVMLSTGEFGFLVVPVAYEREVRARLGLGYE